MTDAQLLELFAEDEYLMRKLVDIMERSKQYPNADYDKDAPTIDGTTRGLILMIEAGLLS